MVGLYSAYQPQGQYRLAPQHPQLQISRNRSQKEGRNMLPRPGRGLGGNTLGFPMPSLLRTPIYYSSPFCSKVNLRVMAEVLIYINQRHFSETVDPIRSDSAAFRSTKHTSTLSSIPSRKDLQKLMLMAHISSTEKKLGIHSVRIWLIPFTLLRFPTLDSYSQKIGQLYLYQRHTRLDYPSGTSKPQHSWLNYCMKSIPLTSGKRGVLWKVDLDNNDASSTL